MKMHSIPAILQNQFGNNIMHMSRQTGLSEITIAKYRHDWGCQWHMIIDGDLFTKHKSTKRFEVDHGNVPDFSDRVCNSVRTGRS